MTSDHRHHSNRDQAIAHYRVPPHSIEAEQSLIGALLLDNSAWDRVADLIVTEHLYLESHRRIFEHMERLFSAAKPVDVVTVYEALKQTKDAERVGGLAYLAEVANATPSAANIERYAEIIVERVTLRRIIETCEDIIGSAFQPAGRLAKEILDSAEARILAIREAAPAAKGGFVPITPLLGDLVGRVQTLFDRDDPQAISGTPYGMADLDAIMQGLHGGDMIVLGGRPGMGKTSFALNVAENVALTSRLPVAIFSMEMPSVQLAARFVASCGRLDQSRLRSGRLTDDDWQRFTVALGQLHEAPIYIDESPGLTPIEVRARCRRLQHQYGQLGLVVVDYLQLMSAVRANENRTQELSEISRSIKSLAKELNVPIFALSQLNRGLEQRQDKRPMASDLRESGAIEQDADIILFVYRDEVYDPQSPDKGTAEIIVAKHRNGETGKVRLTFLGASTRFEDYAEAPT